MLVLLLSDVMTRALAELAPAADRWLVAVSGGSDSVAALRLMLDAGRDVVVAHLDHQLRPGSEADAAFVADLCDSLGVPFHSAVVDVRKVAAERGWNLEDAARRVRYKFLHDVARRSSADAVIVAHTRDDQAETFLRQALRGSAFPTGMPAKRGKIVRPLLKVGREALRLYLSDLGQAWREDPSNLDADNQERAWLRHEVVPLLKGRYPHAPAQLARTAAGLGEARDAIDEVASRLYGTSSLSVSAVARAPAALQRAALAGLLRAAGSEARFDLLEDARAVLARIGDLDDPSSAAPWRQSVGQGKVLRIAYGRIEVAGLAEPAGRLPVRVANYAAFERALEASGGTPPDAPGESAITDLLLEHGELMLRHRAHGDSIRLPAGSKLVSDLLIDLKVPREERDALRLLAAGSNVLWIEGVAAAHSDAVPPTVAGDRHWMALALRQAELAAAAGELPVGAVVVRGGKVLAAAHNTSHGDHDATAHAETIALREAGASEGDWRLAGATLYVTLEPCPMCFGAVLQTQLDRVVFGASNLREGALGSVVDLRIGKWKRVPAVEGGLMAKESSKLLKSFFSRRR